MSKPWEKDWSADSADTGAKPWERDFEVEDGSGEKKRERRQSKATAVDYVRAVDSGLAQGVAGIAGGVGTFIQDPAANTLSGVVGAAHMADRGVTWLLNKAGVDAEVNPTLQEHARMSSRFAAESREAQANDPTNLPARAGRYLQRDSERAIREIKANDQANNPELIAQQQNMGQAEGFVDNLKAVVDNPLAFTNTLARSVPDMAAGVGVGSTLHRAGAGLGTVSTAGTLTEAGSSALQGRQGVYQQVAEMPLQTLANSPRFQEVLRETGGDAERARELLANELADQVPLLTGTGTAIGTVLTNRLFGGDATAKTIAGVERMTAKEFGKRTLQDTLEEGFQGVPEDTVQFGATVQADPSEEYDPGGSLAQNLTAGLAMGAGGHGFGYARENIGAMRGTQNEQDNTGGSSGSIINEGASKTQAAPAQAPEAARGDGAAAAGVPDARAGAGVRADGVGKKQVFNIGGRDPHTATFEHKDDGRLIRTITYPDGQSSTETLVTDRNDNQSWVSQSAYEKGEFYPVQLSEAEASTTIRDDLAGKPATVVPDAGAGDVQAAGVATGDTEAAERALREPVSLTALDRANEIDTEVGRITARLQELDPANGYGPVFDAERTELQQQAEQLQAERERIAATWPSKIDGAPTQFSTEAGVKLDGQYAVMDAADLITSHDENLRANPLYPKELQPRDRSRSASEIQVSGIVQKLDPARLGLSADAATGAPIVGADGLVESGNARTIALKRVYQANGQKAADYKAWLQQTAEQFGLSPAAVQGMEKPVLVRVRSTPVNRAEFARQANASTVQRMSPAEQAAADAKRLNSLEGLEPDDMGDFASSHDFIRQFMATLPVTEQSDMIESDGRLSTAGYRRIQNAVLAKAYGDSPTLRRMTESLDNNLANVSKALVRVAPTIAAARERMQAGSLYEADIAPDLVQAVEGLSALKEKGWTVEQELGQVDLTGPKYSAEATELLRFLSDNARSPRRIAEFLQRYYEALEAAGDPNQGSLLGDTGPAPTRSDLLQQAKGPTDATDQLATATATQQPGAAPAPVAVGGQEPGGTPGGGDGAQGDAAGAQGVADDLQAQRAAAVRDFKDALADLATIASKHTRAAMVPEDTPDLMPTLTRLFDSAIRMVGTDMKAATRWVKEQLKKDPKFKTFWNKIAPATYNKAALAALEAKPQAAQASLFDDEAAADDALQGDLFAAAPAAAPKAASPAPQKAAGRTVVIDGIEHDLDAENFGLKPWPKTLKDSDPLLVDTSTKSPDSMVVFEDMAMPRAEMHRIIIEWHFERAQPAPADRKPIAYVMGGGGASGKGTIKKLLRAQGLINDDGAVNLDPDEIKEKIPEYEQILRAGDSRAAAVVHEESSTLSKQIKKRAMDGRYDLVLDVTLGDRTKGEQYLNDLKAAGYEVRLFGVTTDPATSVVRADNRAREKGRYVPIKDLLKAHKGFNAAFEAYAKIVDTAMLYENTDGRQKLAEATAGQQLQTVNGYNVVAERSDINEQASTLGEIAGRAGSRVSGRGQSPQSGVREPELAGDRNGLDRGSAAQSGRVQRAAQGGSGGRVRGGPSSELGQVNADDRPGEGNAQGQGAAQQAKDAAQMTGQDGGETRLSRGAATGDARVSVDALQALADRIKKTMPNMPRVRVLADPSEAPKALRQYILNQGAWADVEGAMHAGEFYLFASGLADEARAEHVLAEHEAAHFGLRAVLGPALKTALNLIYLENAAVRKAAAQLQARGKLSNTEATEEVIVDIPTADLARLKGWRKVVRVVADALSKRGFTALADRLSAWLNGTLTQQQRADLMVAELVGAARDYMHGKRAGQRGRARGTRLSGTLAEDIERQEKWLQSEARARGFKDIEDLLEKDYPLFEQLATLWREKNPADSLLSRGADQDAAIWSEQDTRARRKAVLQILGDGWTAGPGIEGARDKFTRKEGDVSVILFRQRTVDGNYYVGWSRRGKGGAFDSTAKTLAEAAEKANAMFTGSPTMLSRAPAKKTAADRAEAILQKKAAGFAPLDAIAKAATTITGAERLTGAIYDRAAGLLARLTPEKVKAGIVSDYGVPEAVIDQRIMLQGRQRVQLRKAGQLIEKLATLTREESRVAYEWMNMDGSDPKAYLSKMQGLPEESVLVLQDVQKLIDDLSQEAVRLGQLEPEAFKRNRFAYLRRSYAKHILEQTAGEKAKRSRVISILGDQYKGRGLTQLAAMDKIKAGAPDWWTRKLKPGQADTALKGEKLVRLERLAATGAGTRALPGMTGRGDGKVLEVAYWPAGETVPAKYADWRRADTWEVRDVKGGNAILWRDFTKDEREQMGEIDEARFAIAKTLHGMIHDVEVGRYLEWLGKNYAKSEGQPVPGVVVEASERMRDTFAPSEWVKVPDTKIPGTSVLKYGKLAGKYLPGPIWNDLRQVVAGGRFRPFGDTYAAILSAWKTSKTALSPAVHMNNVMSNFVMADWQDVRAAHVGKSLRIILAASGKKGGITDTEAATEILNRYKDSGGDVGSWVTQEVARDQMEPLLAGLEQELAATDGQSLNAQAGVFAALQHVLYARFPEAWESFKAGKAGKVTVGGANKLIDLYQAEDDVFRLAAWLKAKEEGADDLSAGKLARRSFLDYNINAPWIQAMRQSAWPFISFTYRAVPLLAEIAGKKPHKLFKIMMLAGGLNALGVLMGGGGDDDERKLLPDEKAGSIWGMVPKLIRMPWNDAHGSPVYLDIRRWVPVGDVFDIGQGHAAIPMLPGLMPGGPLVIAGEVVLNRSAFTGKPISLETDTPLQKATKLGDYLYKAFAPNILGLPNTYATEGVVGSMTGRTDAFGREFSTAQAVASSFGVKLGSYPTDVLRRNQAAATMAKTSEIDKQIAQLKRQLQTGRLTREEFDEAVAVEIEKKRKVVGEFREKLQ